MYEIYHNDNIGILDSLSDIDLIYLDPPFNTGKQQAIHGISYTDNYIDYGDFLRKRLYLCYRTLKTIGSLFLHLDYREVHYAKIWLDEIFGRSNFRNEIIWSYDYGGRPKNKWPTKHDTILWYTKSDNYTFKYDEIDRIPYMAPGLVGAEKAERGKTPTDVWWNTIVHTTGSERVDYPTQKPIIIMEWIIKVHSNIGDMILDPFCGSGTTIEAAVKHNRNAIGIDISEQAIQITLERLLKYDY